MRLFKRIKKEIDVNAPDLSDRISASVEWEEIARKNGVKRGSEKSVRRPFGFACLATALLAVIIVPLCIVFTNNTSPISPAYATYDVVIDVNPNISFSVNKDDKITAQRGLNEDGVVFLYGKNYVGKDIDVATQSVVTELKNKGLIVSGSVVRISAYDHKTRVIKDDVQSKIEKIMEQVIGGDVTFLFLSDEELDKIEDYYENHTVKEDEKVIVEEFKKKVLKIADEKITATRELIKDLFVYDNDGKEVVLSASDADKVNAYVLKYKTEIDFNLNEKIDKEDFEEFIEDLEETCEELTESVRELSEKREDYSELMEDLIDLVKDCLWDD